MTEPTTSLSTPDVTPVQKLAGAGLVLLGAIVTLVNAFGWAEVDAIEGAAITGVYVAGAGFALAADAVIRNGRARAFLHQPKGEVAAETVDSATPGA